MKEQLVMVAYVGAKPMAYDNVAKSGKTWFGNGDIQEVTPAQAQILTRYPDQWALVDEDERAIVDVPQMITVTDEDGDAVLVNQESLNKPLEKMTKAELCAYAKEHWGEDLDPALAKKLLIDQIEEWTALRPEVVRQS